ncbi:MAG TPA: nucleoside triphosphate pyrophosphohydrolase [Candidatus Paceibacterota bacterium]
MKKVYYHKLIRDKIPERITQRGGKYSVKKLDKKEFEGELLKKVGEEADGLLSAKNKQELISELADVLVVIEEVKKLKRISGRQIFQALKTNYARKGGFRKKLFLDWSSDTGYKTNERRYGRK